MASVKKIIVAPFMALAAEGAAPDFDRFRPSDMVLLVIFSDGTAAAYPVGDKCSVTF